MCGISGIVGPDYSSVGPDNLLLSQKHRGPDYSSHYYCHKNKILLCHNRLSIIDLSSSSNQPFYCKESRISIVYNGEIYNYKEIKKTIGSSYKFKTESDTEVLVASYLKWGKKCLDRFVGMFAFALWDEDNELLFAARDRFGVKPFYYTLNNQSFYFSSEIHTLFKAGVPKMANSKVWANYFAFGTYDYLEHTFWENIYALEPGGYLTMKNGNLKISNWYDLKREVDKIDSYDISLESYEELLIDSVKLRFRSDVPVGINLSGGVDSSLLLGLISKIFGSDKELTTYTFSSKNPDYDESPWVKEMIGGTNYSNKVCYLEPKNIIDLAGRIHEFQDGPYGGFPTIAYSQLFKYAKENGVSVLLDGQGLDEQWAGYSYYNSALDKSYKLSSEARGPVQGSKTDPFRFNCMSRDFRNLASPYYYQKEFLDNVRNLQYRDIRITKIPRTLRFNDRISMMYGVELREPFLDHRLVEMSLAFENDMKIRNGVQKYGLRKISRKYIPPRLYRAPKRPVQTPQREWLKNDLKDWADSRIHIMLEKYDGSWFDSKKVKKEWGKYLKEDIDNSFFVWQWINLSFYCD